jgi:hypothetical protein
MQMPKRGAMWGSLSKPRGQYVHLLSIFSFLVP